MKFKYFKTKIQGGCYFEFQRGKWDGRSHWKTDSLFLYADIFDSLKLFYIFSEALEAFNYYGPNEITRQIWHKLMQNANQAGGETADLISEAAPWVEENFAQNEVFYVLGV